MKIDESYIVRRKFLCGMLGGGAAAMGAAAAVPMAYYAGNLCDNPPPDYIVLEKADFDLEPGQSKTLAYGNLPVLLLRAPEPGSELKVFNAKCTHLDCNVMYEAGENQDMIYCRCHKAHYNLDGTVHDGPPPRRLAEFFTKPLGDKLVVALEEANLDKAS